MIFMNIKYLFAIVLLVFALCALPAVGEPVEIYKGEISPIAPSVFVKTLDGDTVQIPTLTPLGILQYLDIRGKIEMDAANGVLDEQTSALLIAGIDGFMAGDTLWSILIDGVRLEDLVDDPTLALTSFPISVGSTITYQYGEEAIITVTLATDIDDGSGALGGGGGDGDGEASGFVSGLASTSTIPDCTPGALKCTTCDPGTEWNGQKCADIPDCDPGALNCDCGEGKEWKDRTNCYIIPECTLGALTCSECKEGEEWNTNTGECDIIPECTLGALTCSECKEGEEWNMNTGECDIIPECTPGALSCSCGEGKYWKDRTSCELIPECTSGALSCSTCPTGTKWDGQTCKSFTCDTGYIPQGNECVFDRQAACRAAGGVLEEGTGTCVKYEATSKCSDGKALVSGMCPVDPITTQWQSEFDTPSKPRYSTFRKVFQDENGVWYGYWYQGCDYEGNGNLETCHTPDPDFTNGNLFPRCPTGELAIDGCYVAPTKCYDNTFPTAQGCRVEIPITEPTTDENENLVPAGAALMTQFVSPLITDGDEIDTTTGNLDDPDGNQGNPSDKTDNQNKGKGNNNDKNDNKTDNKNKGKGNNNDKNDDKTDNQNKGKGNNNDKNDDKTDNQNKGKRNNNGNGNDNNNDPVDPVDPADPGDDDDTNDEIDPVDPVDPVDPNDFDNPGNNGGTNNGIGDGNNGGTNNENGNGNGNEE
jgi:hypothetical protein